MKPMFELSRKLKRKRLGITIAESMVSLLVLSVISIMMVRASYQLKGFTRVQHQRSVANQQLSQICESIYAMPFEQVTAEQVGKLTISPDAKELLVESKFKIDIREKSKIEKRVELTLDWQTKPGVRIKPLKLFLWKFKPQSKLHDGQEKAEENS